ncbi:MAG: hypothetical protein DRI56_06685 [Chloroflexota bacterium]|nr:MAG: hypothetical protein B6243_00230 [Anaerolineaceae bacterium 4572_5.2]RLD07540.1 MAG: hypothetical protein DRI56_06685 [Chloroflexota bacterium]
MTEKPIALIIEDDSDQAEIFTQALRQAGYETHTSYDGKDGLKCIRELRPHIVILDLHLPFLQGDEILKIVRQDPEIKDTKIILATANPQWAEPLREESDLVLIKPVAFGQLQILATRLLSDKSLR